MPRPYKQFSYRGYDDMGTDEMYDFCGAAQLVSVLH